MVFAKTPQAAAKLSAQVSSRSMEKEYLAVTTGMPEPQKGELRDWLLRDGKVNTSAVVTEGTPQAKEAVLDYEVEQVSENGQQALDSYLASHRAASPDPCAVCACGISACG